MEILSLRPSKSRNEKLCGCLQQKKTQWGIEDEDWKIIMLLALIRKFLRHSKQIIKRNQQQVLNRYKALTASFGQNTNNSFDCIEPLNPKIQNLKQALEAYTELKKKILSHLKIKKRQYISNNKLAATYTNNPINYQLLGITCNIQPEKTPQLILVQSSVNSNTPIDNKNTPKDSPMQTPNKFTPYCLTLPQQKPQKITYHHEIPNREKGGKKYLISSKKLVNKFMQRRANEIQTFNRMNKTIEKCCFNNQLTTSIESFAIFTRNLSTIKNNLSYSTYKIFDQKIEFQQRIFSEVGLLINGLHRSFNYFRDLASSNKQCMEILSKCSRNKFTQKQEKQEEKELTTTIKYFIKLATHTIQFIKTLQVSPNFKSILFGKGKIIEKLLPIFTLIRYTANYLNKQLENIDYKTKKVVRQKITQSEQWRYAFMKKYRSQQNLKRVRF